MGYWRDSFLDLILIPLSLLLPLLYHLWLWRAVRLRPLSTAFGICSATRRRWAISAMKDSEKKGLLVVQSVRNLILGSAMMATTAVLLCTGIAAVLSSTYAVKKPLSDAVLGAHGECMLAVKYAVLLLLFAFAFLCHSLAICVLNQATFLVNTSASLFPADEMLPTGDYVGAILGRGFTLNFVGNRLFSAGVPLLLWILGPLLAFLASMVVIRILYKLDIVNIKEGDHSGSKSNTNHAPPLHAM